MPYNHLSAEEERVIVSKGTERPFTSKGTERPFTGEYDKLFSPGTFICRRCNNPLYPAEAKFHSGCGWPSFDEEYADSVERHADADGRRVEITCARCQAHLGHVFEGEGFTDKGTRHCVNSLSVRFIPEGGELPPVLGLHPRAALARPRFYPRPVCDGLHGENLSTPSANNELG